jgi:hypothetical protein
MALLLRGLFYFHARAIFYRHEPIFASENSRFGETDYNISFHFQNSMCLCLHNHFYFYRSEDGYTFVVKDTEKFASEIIPEVCGVEYRCCLFTCLGILSYAFHLSIDAVLQAQQLQQFCASTQFLRLPQD